MPLLQTPKKVSAAGAFGSVSLLKSFTASAKSVLEESLLMITETHIIELRTNKFTLGTGTVTYVASVSLLAKLKFRRQESLSLFFKAAPDDPVIYMCPDSAECVQQIQTVLRRHGVRGKHTNAATQRSVQAALGIVAEIQRRERALESDGGEDPTPAKVDEIMDLYRQAAERFETAGDPRHEEVMGHMRKFLARPLVASVLDGSYRATVAASSSAAGAESEARGGALDTPSSSTGEPQTSMASLSSMSPTSTTLSTTPPPSPVRETGGTDLTLRRMDDVTEELRREMEEFKTGVGGGMPDLDRDIANGEEADASDPAAEGGEGDEGNFGADDAHDDDSLAELDAMLNAADKELFDILNA